MVLRREDVARRPAHFGAERGQRLDQHRGLDGHGQRTGNARALQRLRGAIFAAQRHQARHFGFGDVDFLAPESGEADVGNDIITGVGGESGHGESPYRLRSTAGERPRKHARALAETPSPIKYKLFFIRSEEHTSELQSLMRTSYAVFCLKKKTEKAYNQHVWK